MQKYKAQNNIKVGNISLNSCISQYRYPCLSPEIFVTMCISIHTCISWHCQLRGSGSNDAPSHQGPISWYPYHLLSNL
uniref:Uncharacterized protein n=1 Tax=Marmota marmota marmota TaxID=9994 RepID=A0A8C5ZFI7_MARMA